MSGHPALRRHTPRPLHPVSASFGGGEQPAVGPASIPSDAFRIKRLDGSDPLHAMACKDLFTRRTQLCAVLLQAVLNGCIITQLFSAKAGSIPRTSLLLLWCSEMATLCPCRT
jgi:hypothetical protein